MLNLSHDNKLRNFSSAKEFGALILLLKITITLLTLYVYAKFSPFPDSERYLRAQVNGWNVIYLFNRTLFSDFIYSFLKHILIYNTAVHLFVSLTVGGILWYLAKDDYKYANRPLFWACLLLPHFLIWSGIVGKEVLVIAGFLLFIKGCVDLVVWNKLKPIPLLLGCFIGFILRPHYALAYSYLFVISFIIAKSKICFIGRFSFQNSLILLAIVLAYLVLLYNLFFPVLVDSFEGFMNEVSRYFFVFTQSNGNRWDVIWKHTADFFYNMPWGIPISIIGPTYTEALNKPIFFPVFIEGCIALLLLVACSYQLLKLAASNRNYRTIVIWGFLPAMISGVLINYPFGLFNPGSAIRYKQSLAPLIYFYPIFLMAAARRKLACEPFSNEA